MYHFSFVAMESGMVDYKNHIGVDDIITKIGQGENGITHYLLEGKKP